MTESARHHRENALLLAAVRDDAAPAGSPDALDWDYLITASQRQGVTPILHRWMGTHGLSVPAETASTLGATHWVNHFRTQALLGELAAVRAAAATARIPLLPLKGAALAGTVYPAPELRPMSDLDLLAHPDDLPRLREHFAARAYTEEAQPVSLLPERLHDPLRQEWKFDVMRGGFPVLVEVRAEPLDPGLHPLTDLDPTLTARLHAHTERMWARATSDTTGLRAAPEDLLLHVASHMTTRHADFRLIWLLDVRQIIRHAPAFDWDYLAREAKALGLATPVHAALTAAAHWLAAPLPPRWRGDRSPLAPRFHPVDRLEWVALRSRERELASSDLTALEPSPAWRAAASIARVSWVARLRALRWLLLPSRAYLAGWRNRPTETAGPWYPGTAAFRLAVTVVVWLSTLARYARLPLLGSLGDRLMRRLNPFGEYVSRG